MRKRSQSFYAKTKEEFEEIIEENKNEKSTTIQNDRLPRKKSKISLMLEDSDDDSLGVKVEEDDQFNKIPCIDIVENDDQLGVSNPFTIMENILSMEDEETLLINSLENINLSYRNRDKNLFLESVSNFYLSSKDRLKDDLANGFSYNSSSKSENKISRSFSLDSLNIIDFDELTHSSDYNPIMMDPMIKQNIKLTDEVVKIILIGDENVGKTLLIDKLINDSVKSIIHTKSLEIKKKRIKLLERILTLEFWDTNKQILNSKICETYFKLCDGFIIIYDPLSLESIQFIENKINILTQKTNLMSLLLIANIKFADVTDPSSIKQAQKIFSENDAIIKKLCHKYDIKINYIDIKNLKMFKKTIIKFLSFVYVRKGISKSKCKSRNKNKISNEEIGSELINFNISRRSYSNSKNHDEDYLCIN